MRIFLQILCKFFAKAEIPYECQINCLSEVASLESSTLNVQHKFQIFVITQDP